LVTALLKMTVQTVGGGVQLAVFKPFDGQVVVIEGGVLYFRVGLYPVQTFTVLTPERIRIFNRLAIHLVVLFTIDERPVSYLLIYWVYFCICHYCTPPFVESVVIVGFGIQSGHARKANDLSSPCEPPNNELD